MSQMRLFGGMQSCKKDSKTKFIEQGEPWQKTKIRDIARGQIMQDFIVLQTISLDSVSSMRREYRVLSSVLIYV